MRLIDADSLIELVTDSTILGDGFKTAFCALVNGEPTVKVQKTGKWIKDEEQSKEHTEPIFICSCCQNNSAWGTEERTRYCSFCGADMRGNKHETD